MSVGGRGGEIVPYAFETITYGLKGTKIDYMGRSVDPSSRSLYMHV